MNTDDLERLKEKEDAAIKVIDILAANLSVPRLPPALRSRYPNQQYRF
jgi:hypothetical protein